MTENPDGPTPDSAGRKGFVLRMAWGWILVVVALFLFLAVASYDPRDGWVSDYPRNPSPANLCGPVGAFTSAGLRCMIGRGAYPLLVLAGVAGVCLVFRRPIRNPGLRIGSGVALVVAWACLADLMSGGEGASAAGPGGMLGRLLNEYIFLPCGWGAWLALLAILLASLFFLADMAPVAWARAALRAWRAGRLRKGKLKGTVDAGPEPSRDARELPESQIWGAETEPLLAPPTAEASYAAAAPFANVQRAPAEPAPLREATPPDPDEMAAFTEAETQIVYGPLRPREEEPRAAAQATPPPEPREPLPPDPAEEDEPAEEPVEAPRATLPESVLTAPEPPASEEAPEPEPSEPGAEEAEPPLDEDEGPPEEDEPSEPVPEGEADEEDDGEKPPVPRPARPKPAPPPRRTSAVDDGFELPSAQLLDLPEEGDRSSDDERFQLTARLLENTLAEFNVDAQVVEVDRGPVITMYEIELAPGIKIGRVNNLSDDIARALSATTVRIVAPLPGKSTVGIEVPNAVRETVCLRDLFESDVLERKQLAIPMLIGKDASGQPLVADLAQMPHLLIAGATGTGKSVCINSLIVSMLLTQHPDRLKMLLIDPKMVEFSQFKEVPHLMAPVVTDMKKATSVLEWACVRMDQRYEFLSAVGVRNIVSFNSLGEAGVRERLGADEDADLDDFPTHLPYIVLVIDELADLMMMARKEVEGSIIRIAQKARAVGIHLVIATQRPSVDVITGLIKANLPSRIALQVASKVDSRTILDRNGAEKLLGKGDMLFLPPGSSKLIRAQGSYVSDPEIRRVCKQLESHAKPVFDDELVRQRSMGEQPPWERDELFVEAVRVIAQTQRGSVSLLQRRLTIGYSRAARLVDMMAEMSLIGDYKGSQAREVLVTPEEWEEMLEQFQTE